MRAFALLYLLSLHLAFAIQDSYKRPSLEQCDEISIESPYSWAITILSDGSGHIGYGSSGTDRVSFPKGTFDFASAYKELIGISGENVSSAKSICFFLHRKGDESTSAIQTTNIDFFMKFFEKARKGSSGFEETRLPSIWEKHSPQDIN